VISSASKAVISSELSRRMDYSTLLLAVISPAS